MILLVGLAAACHSPDATLPASAAFTNSPVEFLGSTQCAVCHASQYQDWSGSHHDLAMQHATAKTVLGDFDNASIRVGDVLSSFFTRNGRYWVRTDNEAGELAEFEIRYTFGVAPLQQYLVEFSGGRLQALPLAWDGRKKSAGGQRWFHIYAQEFIASDDPLHWTGRAQNWNYMCAECHSTNLQKNFAGATQSFDTTWSEINVGCEGCHGPGSRHVAAANAGTVERTTGLLVDLDDTKQARWQMNSQSGIAQRSELRVRPPQQPESCGRCHARRAAITGEYQYGRSLLDTHMPALLDEPLYYADGQIHGEAYVWGSFVQSKMYQAGVSCTDCHDPHTATLRTSGKPSDICATCHLPSRFASSDHHRHPPEQVVCVDCHMPSRNYMVIDGRRDHSFRVPRPDLTISTGSPNACNNCHAQQGPEWAAAAVDDWYGKTRQGHYAGAIHAGRGVAAGANKALADATRNSAFPGIARATALSLLVPPLDSNSVGAIRDGLNNADPLLRLGALRALRGAASELALAGGTPLLDDPVRAVRIEAASILSPARRGLPQSAQAAFRAAEKEYIDAQLAAAERPEAHSNLASIYLARGDTERAEASLLRALAMEPGAVVARVNLADLYRQLARDEDAMLLLQAGLELDTDSAALRHSLGLLLVRGGQAEVALPELRRAAVLEPGNRRYAYVYAVALNSLGHADEAMAAMQDASQAFPGDFDIGWGLTTMFYATGRNEDARREALRMQAQYPENADIATLLGRLKAR
ncbi:MAG: tetratricopeptide repeat protein [Gammaproteobacteria bacterium]|nr:tetratricopeptide repeat protein [Gammaproteobacteria bacterium]